MSESNNRYWREQEDYGDSRVKRVQDALGVEWLQTSEISTRLEMPANLVLNILHYLNYTNRVACRIGRSGKYRGYQWRLA